MQYEDAPVRVTSTDVIHRHREATLLKHVPGHLFSFEEKVFGVLTVSQLLGDLAAVLCVWSVTGSFPFVTRLVVSAFVMVPLLLLTHGKVQERTLASWLLAYMRSRWAAHTSSWQALGEVHLQTDGTPTTRTKEGAKSVGASIQRTWIPVDVLEEGIAGYAASAGKGTSGRYWAVIECQGRNLRFLSEVEQLQQFTRFETFLSGLEFRLQFLSHVEQVDSEQYPPLRLQEAALSTLNTTPHLAALQRASIAYQKQHLRRCSLVRHFVVVAATFQEEKARSGDGEKRSVVSFFWRLLFKPKQEEVSQQQVLDQLHARLSVLKKLLHQLDVHYHMLDDAALLQQFVQCLAMGVTPPSFTPHLIDEVANAILHLPVEPMASSMSHHNDAVPSLNPVQEREQSVLHNTAPTRSLHSNKVRRRVYKKYINGLHGRLLYTSTSPQTRFEAGVLQFADLVAPSRVELAPDLIEVNVRGQRRFQRYVQVVGYGNALLCGWVSDLTELGLPMVISTSFEPLDSQYMMNRLEMQLVRLESRRLADQKAIRIGRASRTLEADEIRTVTQALAARSMKVYAVQMTIGIHAGSRERLEQRTRYLLSHLRQKQLKVRPATYRQERAWQATLPICPVPELDSSVNLPSDVLSSFLNFSSGNIGTPTGAFLGFTGSGTSLRPVYFNPWSVEIANPHMCIIGETGQGKSFDCKVLMTGLMGMGIADVVVLDRDDDYLPLHRYLHQESQRYDLARGCPINFFDLPFAPSDVDPDDTSDLLSEFIDNQLLVGLTLLICDTDTRLSRIEEAYLMHVARKIYAAKGITSESIRSHPETLLCPMPTLREFISVMRDTLASSASMQESLLERLEKAAYLFQGQTSVSIDKPLTIFSIHDLDEKWYALMTFTVQNFLMRHRALRKDERYLAYVVEEASYMLKHAAGRKYLESGSRGFRKLGIAQITLSQHPREFMQEGAVVLNNCGAACYLGMQHYAARELHLPDELERTLTSAVPGQVVMRVGNEYAAVTVSASPLHRTIFTTSPQEQKRQRERSRQRPLSSTVAHPL